MQQEHTADRDEQPKDHVESDRFTETDVIDEHWKSREIWVRLAFTLIMAVLLGLAWAVGAVVVVLQFGWVLFTGEPKRELTRTGAQLAAYTAEIIEYMTFNREDRPFPFDREWPGPATSRP